jgi:hypothetical protein
VAGGRSSSFGGVASFAAHCGYMWLKGLLTACALHRVVSYLTRSRKLSILAARCFVLNGVIFLGRVGTFHSLALFCSQNTVQLMTASPVLSM